MFIDVCMHRTAVPLNQDTAKRMLDPNYKPPVRLLYSNQPPFSNRHHLSYLSFPLSICSHLTLTLTYCIEGCECCSSQAAHPDAAGVPARARGRGTRRALPRTTTGRHRARYPSKPEHAPRRRRRSCGPHCYSCCNTVEDHHTGAE